MELFEQRRYQFCPHCGTFEFLEATAEDGIKVLDRPAAATACPLCSAPLTKSLLDGAYEIQYCERCRGILMRTALFADAVERRRARQSGPGAPPVPLDPRELKRRVTCPSCRTQMDVHPYYGPGNVVIDSCSRCNLVWLDFAELRQITEARGQDRGRSWRTDTASSDSPAPWVFGGQWTSVTDLFDDSDD
jgi:Zn-finger nucleic acid-binding protein